MDNGTVDIINLSLHIVLLGVKICIFYILFIINIEKIISDFMKILFMIFTLGFIGAEVIFLLNFYSYIDFYMYEFIAIIDQIYTTMLIIYIFKELNNGKKA